MNKILSQYLFLVCVFVFSYKSICMEERRKRQVVFDSGFILRAQRLPLIGSSMCNYMNRVNTTERIRNYQNFNSPSLANISLEQKQKLLEVKKISDQVVSYANLLSGVAQGQSVVSSLNLTNPFSFQVVGLNQDFTIQNAHLQDLLDSSLYILYKPDGMPKAHLNFGEQCSLARTVAHYLKQEIPDGYEAVIKSFVASGKPGFDQILKEESKGGIWPSQPKWLTSKEYPDNPSEFREKILKNPIVRDLKYTMQSFKKHKLDEATRMLNIYKDYTMYNSCSPQEDYAAMRNVYDELFQKFCLDHILKPNNISANPEIMGILKEVVPNVGDPQKVMSYLVGILVEKQHDSAYCNAIKPLFDERGLPRLYDYDKALFEDITIPTSITLPEHLNDRELLFKIAHLAANRKEVDLETYRNAVRYVAKACNNVHNKKYYAELAANMIDALAGKTDAILLQCPNLAQVNLNESQERLQQRIIPSILNLVDEINKTKDHYYIKQERSLLGTLIKQFSELDGSFEKQSALDATIKEIVDKLDVFGRIELRRSLSQEFLFAHCIELLTTGRDISCNRAWLERSVGIKAKVLDAKIRYHQKLMTELPTKATTSPFNNEQTKELVQKFHEMSEEARRLGYDNRLVLAKGVFHVSKDAVAILLTDFPAQEIAIYCKEIASDPAEYVLGSIKSIGQLSHFVKDYIEHNSMLSTLDQQLNYARRWNESIHHFFEGWDNLKHDQKKEFVARLIVDTALAKGGGKAVQTVSKSVSGCILDFCHDIGPSRFRGVGAAVLSRSHATAQGALLGVADGIEAVGNVAASMPMAIVAGGNQTSFELSQATNGGGGSDSFTSKLGRLIPKTPIETLIKNDKDVLFVVESEHKNLIKEFNITRKHFDHMFTDLHMKEGLSKLGNCREEILEALVEKVLMADNVNLLEEPACQIETIINNCEVTFRIRVIDGKVLSFNGFAGYSDRVIGKLIKI